MKRLYLAVFFVALLLTQLGSLGHDYHIHDSGDMCEYCLSAQGLDHVAIPAILSVAVTPSSYLQAEISRVIIFNSVLRRYSARAPPRFI